VTSVVNLEGQSASIRKVLAVVCEEAADREVIDRACALAQEHHARLTLLGLCSTNPMFYVSGLTPFTAFAAGPPVPRSQRVEEMTRHLHLLVDELPPGVPCTLVYSRPRFGAAAELEEFAREHDVVIAGRRALSRRQRARLARMLPNSRLVFAEAAGGTREARAEA
jgi:hypothetical protein